MARIDGTDDSEVLIGTPAADVMRGGRGDDELRGGEGGDDLDGGEGDDILHGGGGNDVLTANIGEGSGALYGEDGNDSLRVLMRNVVPAGPEHMLLDGGSGDDNLFYSGPLRYNTQATGYGASIVSMVGGEGSDRIYVSNGPAVVIDAGGGNDIVTIGHDGFPDTRYTVALGSGRDLLILESGAGLGPGDHPAVTITDFSAGPDGDMINLLGHLGSRLLDWDYATNPFATGHLRLVQSGSDAVLQIRPEGSGLFGIFVDLIRFANLQASTLTDANLGLDPAGGSSAPLAVTGSADSDFILGRAGADMLSGGGGRDIITGGLGDDQLYGGDGPDSLDGQYGDDQIYGEAGADSVNDTLGGDDQLFGGAGNDSLQVVRRDTPGTVAAASSNVLLDGGTENDSLNFIGRAGDRALLIGGSGNDSFLIQGAGMVEADAGEGDDRVSAGMALMQTVTLGAGADLLTLRNNSGTGGSVTVTDYSIADDRVAMIDHLLGSLTNWDKATNPFATGHLSLVQDGANAVLRIDRDGSGAWRSPAPLVTFLNTNAADLAADDLGGLPQDGSAVPGITITGTASADGLNANLGNDVVLGLGGDDTLNGRAGNDELRGGDGQDTLRGEDGDDQLFGEADADVIEGGNGNDRLAGGAGADRMAGGTGDDVYEVDDAGDLVTEHSAEGAADEVRTSLSNYTLPANVEGLAFLGTTSQGLNFRGNSGSNFISGNDGHDFFRLQDGGDDRAFGGEGNDGFYFGTALTAADQADGGAGNDQLALQGNYHLQLGAGVLSGVETLALLSGADARFGDSAGNRYDYRLIPDDANVAAGQSLIVNFNGLLADEDVWFNGSRESDGSFQFFAGFGRDTLIGGSGNDGFFFGEGRFSATDYIDGLFGAEDQLGLRGDYSAQLVFGEHTIKNVDTIALLSANDVRYGAPGLVVGYNLKSHDGNLAAGAQLTVNGNGLAAAETMKFDGSAETDGFFRLIAGAGADTLTGGSGNDTIFGGNGADDLRGGGGADKFVYISAQNSTPGAADTIRDFAAGDLIDVSAIDAIAGGANDAFTFVSGAFTGAGQLRLVQNGSSWRVEADLDGDGAADFAIDLIVSDPAYTPSAADFML